MIIDSYFISYNYIHYYLCHMSYEDGNLTAIKCSNVGYVSSTLIKSNFDRWWSATTIILYSVNVLKVSAERKITSTFVLSVGYKLSNRKQFISGAFFNIEIQPNNFCWKFSCSKVSILSLIEGLRII